MCGIVGLFLKDKSLEADLGRMLSEMIVTMTDRGPDSAGIAVYNAMPALSGWPSENHRAGGQPTDGF